MDPILDGLKAELEQLWKQIYNVGAVLNTLTEQLRASRDAYRRLETHAAEVSQQLRVREQEIEALKAELVRIEELQHALEHAKQALHTAQTTIEHLEKQNKQLETLSQQYLHEHQRAEQLHIELVTLQGLYAQLTEEYKVVQERLASVATVEQENLQLRSQIAELENERLRAIAEREELAYLRERVEQLQREAEQYAEQLASQHSLAQEYSELAEQNKLLQMHVHALEEELANVRAEAAARAEEVAYLTERLQNAEALVKNSTDDAVEQWRQRIAEELEQQTAAYEQLRQYCQQVESERNSLQELLQKSQQELLVLQQEHSQLKTLLAAVEARAQSSHSIAANEEELVQLRRQLELSEHAATQQRQQLIELSAELEHLREQVYRYQHNEKTLEQRIADAIAPLQIKLEAAEHERRHLQEQLLGQRQRIHQLEDELRSELERNIMLKRRIRQLEGQPTVSQLSFLLSQLQQVYDKISSIESASIPKEYDDELLTLLERLSNSLRLQLQANADDELRDAVLRACQLLEESLLQ